ncbi:MAG TPA: phenylacetate--CoA ligase family protein [Burkholderiaceae bacterium]|nr:phenylacetate--CoA ligase family protein [Burkholderiaceae bacterium]
MNSAANRSTPLVDSWLWASTFGETLAAGFDPQGVGRVHREARLASLLQAASRSPLYRQRLQSLPSGSADLRAIEPVSKTELMARFDDWATDRAVTRRAVEQFLKGTEHLGEAFLGRYLVWTSSGTTGAPGVFVQDAPSLAAYEALDALRLRGPGPGSMPLPAWGAGQRFAFVAATGGHFAGVATIERLRRLTANATSLSPIGWLSPEVQTFSVLTPLRELARALQAYAPTVLITYPSCAAALAQLQLDTTLRLQPHEVWLGGEQLSDGQRALMHAAFACPLRNNYGASEFFSIACECRCGHLHLNDDWVIIEPVDRQLRPVPVGVASHAVLLTNLATPVQPLLRYRLDDAIRFTGQRCACGCSFPVIEVQGRSAHTLVLHDARDRAVTITPLAVETAIEQDGGVTQFQLLCTTPDCLELRFESEAGDAAAAYERARKALAAYLATQGLGNVRIVHGRRAPLRERASGKLCRVQLVPSQNHVDS